MANRDVQDLWRWVDHVLDRKRCEKLVETIELSGETIWEYGFTRVGFMAAVTHRFPVTARYDRENDRVILAPKGETL